MAQEVPIDNPEDKVNPKGTDEGKGTEETNRSDPASTVREKVKERRDRNRPPTKIVVRRLPPTMTEEVFREQVSPIPDHDHLYFVRADLSLGPGAFSRAYINFLHHSDILLFKDQFDGYIFVDMYGNEFSAVVEFAPFQRLPKKNTARRKDTLAGTIEEDPAYISFLQTLEEELKDKENEHTFDYSYQLPEKDDKKVSTTPLLEFLKQRRAERQRCRDERREERKKKEREREVERRKLRDEERRKKRPEKEGAGTKQVLSNPAKEQDSSGKPVKLKEAKPQGERKRDEEKPSSYKDKKYPESRSSVREKPPFKASVGTRQKPVDGRPARDERRSVEELRKKTSTKSTEGERRSAAAKPSRYSEREKDSRSKADQRKSESKRNTKEDVKRSGSVKTVEDSMPEEFDQKSSVRDQLSVSASKKRVGEGSRRFSLEDGRPLIDTSDAKPFRKSAECLLDKQKPASQSTRKQVLETLSKKSGPRDKERLRRSSLESDGVKSASSGSRGPIRRNLSLELESERSREEEEKTEKKRPERRIRNKDRPSIEIYRPGMGKFSKQRIEREKD